MLSLDFISDQWKGSFRQKEDTDMTARAENHWLRLTASFHKLKNWGSIHSIGPAYRVC